MKFIEFDGSLINFSHIVGISAIDPSVPRPGYGIDASAKPYVIAWGTGNQSSRYEYFDTMAEAQARLNALTGMLIT